MNVGDKVRFLNSVGGGVVRGFRGKDQVVVEDEDGFEVPALIKECVVVGGNDMQVHSSNRPKVQAPVETPSPKKPEPKEPSQAAYGPAESGRLPLRPVSEPPDQSKFCIQPLSGADGNGDTGGRASECVSGLSPGRSDGVSAMRL